MLKINRKIEYGLMAIKHMASQPTGQLATARDIASLYGVPYDLLSKVLQRLQSKGIIQSTQGVHGGYRLSRDLTSVNLADFIETLEGPVAVAACQGHHGMDSCGLSSTCNIIPPMAHLNNRIQQVLSGMSLSDLTGPAPVRN